MNKQNIKFCTFHKIIVNYNVEKIENSNLLIITSKNKKGIVLKCKDKIIHSQIKGVYKFKINDDCILENYEFRTIKETNKEINFENLDTLEISTDAISNETIRLKQTKSVKLNEVNFEKIKEKDFPHHYVNYVIIIIVLILLGYIMFKIKLYKKKNMYVKGNTETTSTSHKLSVLEDKGPF